MGKIRKKVFCALAFSLLVLTFGILPNGATLEAKEIKEVKVEFGKVSFENDEVYNNYDVGSDENNPAEYEIIKGIGATDGNNA